MIWKKKMKKTDYPDLEIQEKELEITKKNLEIERFKKTGFPDLEKLPPHNPWKHFLNWLWNRPRWFIEDLYDKYYVFPNLEIQEKELEIMEKNLEIGTLKLKIQLYEIEKKSYSKFPTIVKS